MAASISGRPYLSHSQLSMMRTCPAKFNFVYVEQVRPDFVPSSLLFGGAFHAAIESHYRSLLEGRRATQATLFRIFCEAWWHGLGKAGEGVPVRFNKGEGFVTVRALAERMIHAFLQSPVAHPEGEILAIEEELQVVLAPELPDLLAVVDLMWLDNRGLHLIDFKTARSRWNEQKAEEAAHQLRLYRRLAEHLATALGVTIHPAFVVVTKAKTPAVQRIDVRCDTADDAELVAGVLATWESIQSGRFPPVPSPAACCTCPFKSRCPAFAGG